MRNNQSLVFIQNRRDFCPYQIVNVSLMPTTEKKEQQQEEKVEIKKSVVIDASPEVVFKAITDPDELTNWVRTKPFWNPR